MQAMGSYTGGVTPGEEQVLIIPFEEDAAAQGVERRRLPAPGRGRPVPERGRVERRGARAARVDRGARGPRGRAGRAHGHRRRDQQLPREPAAVAGARRGAADGVRGPCRRRQRARRVAALHAGLGDGRRRPLPVRPVPRRDGPGVRADGDLAPAAGGVHAASRHVDGGRPSPATGHASRWWRREEADGTTSAVIGPDVAVEIVLDTSGSMLERFGGERRIDIAKQVLADLVRKDLPGGPARRVAHVRAGADAPAPRSSRCPSGRSTQSRSRRTSRAWTSCARSRRPSAKAIGAVADDLAGVTGPRIVIVVSDGDESCRGDPAKEVRRLKDGRASTSRSTSWAWRSTTPRCAARSGGSPRWVAAATSTPATPTRSARAIRTAVSAPFQVFDQAGALVARGTVGGAAVELPPGTYRVVVLTDPQMTYEGIVIEAEGSVTVTLPSAGDRPVEADHRSRRPPRRRRALCAGPPAS